MRQIVLDTETTGLEWKKGNRVVEIGCVELQERRPTGRTFWKYMNPERDFEAGAAEVTGLNREMLADKPLFREIADEFMEFIRGAELVIHNAAFDIGFLDHELSLLGPHYGKIGEICTVEDSLLLARQRFPGQRNSLDALCKRLGVDNSGRTKHGALLDAELLCEVYLHLTAGQSEIGFGATDEPATRQAVVATHDFGTASGERPRVKVSDEEHAAHEARLEKLRKKAGSALWDLAQA